MKKSFISEALGVSYIGGAFVTTAQTIAHKFHVPVDWLLAAMSWETGQYSAYDPIKLYVPGAVRGRAWLDPAEYHYAFPPDLLHWAHNVGDWGFGLVGFTPRPVRHYDPLHWNAGDNLPDADSQAKLRMTPLEQLKNCIEDYFRTRISAFSVPTPFATIEDFYSVVYAPGISGKPDSYNWTYAGTSYNKGKQMDIFRRFLGGYDYPRQANDTEQAAPAGLLGQWMVRIGNWVGEFVFNSSGDVWYATIPPSGPLTEIAESARTHGRWESSDTNIRWKFGPASDIRTFQVSLPVPQRKWEGTIQPFGQGSFKMWRGPGEPA